MGAEVITYSQVLPGICDLHTIFRPRQNRHASCDVGFLSINRFRCGGGDMHNAPLGDVEH